MNATPLLASAVLMLAGAGCESDHSEASYRTTPPGDVFRSDTSTDRTTYSYPTDRTATGGSVSTANDVDRTFVSEAISGGLFEVQSSQLALDHSGLDANNRRFAQMMIEDHTRANRELQDIAARHDIVVVARMNSSNQAALDSLRGLGTDEFGARYHSDQVQAHQEAIALFQREAREGQIAELKTFAQRSLPMLQRHLDALQSSPGTGTTSSGIIVPHD